MDRDDLMIKLRALMLDIIGVEIYHIDVDEDLREKQSFDQGSEDILKESINEELNVDMDLSKMKHLTLNKITDYIKQEQPIGLNGSDVQGEPEENETLDFKCLKMVIR